MSDSVPEAPKRAPVAAPSAFLWAALACLASAVLAGVLSVVWSSGEKPGSPHGGFVLAGILIVAAFGLLFAQSRYESWRLAAGIILLGPGGQDALEAPTEAQLRQRKWDILLLVNLAALAAIPRLVALGHSLSAEELAALPFLRNGPMGAITAQLQGANHLLQSLLASLLLNLPLAATGQGGHLPPAWLVRLPAFLFGVLSPPMLYATLRRHGERPVAIGAAALLALSPVAVDCSTQARGYAAMAFFAIAQAYWLSRALQTSRASTWLWWLLCATLGTFAHPSFVLIPVANLLFLIALAVWFSRSLLDRARGQALIEQGLSMTLLWGAFASACYVGVWTAAQQTARPPAETSPAILAHQVIAPLLQLWGGIPPANLLLVYYGLCAVFLALGVAYLALRPSGAAVYLPLVFGVAFLAFEVFPPHDLTLSALSFLLPAFFALLAGGIWQATRWIIGPRRERFAYHVLTFATVCAGFFALTLSNLWEVMRLPRQDFQAAAAAIRNEVGKGEALASVGKGGEYLAEYGLKLEQPLKERQLRGLLRAKKSALIVDAEWRVNPDAPPPALPNFVKTYAKAPLLILPGRFRDWPSRWLDGDSNITVYRMRAEQLPRASDAGRSTER